MQEGEEKSRPEDCNRKLIEDTHAKIDTRLSRIVALELKRQRGQACIDILRREIEELLLITEKEN